ncbi:MAG: glycosyltransferase [Lachnospiraceae bacterium]|nr:glycosyltransferase [Lachnospiraceae bacterium]
MRVLVIPMAAMAETSGSFSRASIIATQLQQSGIETAMCAAEDVNFKGMADVQKFFLSIPMPLGLPRGIAIKVFPIAQKTGITAHKTVKTFEEVLLLTGNIDERYLRKSIGEIREAIQIYKPDVIYSEFNLSAMIAGKLENKKIFLTASMPTQYQGGNTSKYVRGVNKILREFGMMPVKSCLQIFDYADKTFIPSCSELEPFPDKNVIFCGSFRGRKERIQIAQKDKILVYMGNGTISQKKMIKVITTAFKKSNYQVYIAGQGLKHWNQDNIHMDSYFDFNALLPQTAVFVNHGGQNSVIDGLLYGVPQIICPGKVFERKYNSKSIVKNKAGIELSYKNFSAEAISESVEKILLDTQYKNNAEKLGEILESLGGTDNIVNSVKI